MRHLKNRPKLNRNSSHRRCLFANMLKALILEGEIETTIAKAKCLKRSADRLITLAKKGTLEARRRAIADLMIRYNRLTPKQARATKAGDYTSYNGDRKIIEILFAELGPRFADRPGGYTRIIKTGRRVGDNSQTCLISYLRD